MRATSEGTAQAGDGQFPKSLICRPLALCVALCILLCPSLGLSQETARLSLAVSLDSSQDDEYILRISLTNDSSEKVTVQNLDLPWIPPNEFAFVKQANRMDKAHTQLEQFGPMADYMGVLHELEPGKSLDGKINLGDMFPALIEDSQRFGVTVEWSCRSKRKFFTCKEGKGGKFVISKKQTKKNVRESSLASPPPTIQQVK